MAGQAPEWDRLRWYPGRRMRKDPWEEETRAEGLTLVAAELTDLHRFFTGFRVRMDRRPSSASPGRHSKLVISEDLE